ncbi:hypothetical protein E4U41_006845 [Claviceps citrina]|nr:hypothetical protein E4U41_006845 [Claviceps citrina]
MNPSSTQPAQGSAAARQANRPVPFVSSPAPTSLPRPYIQPNGAAATAEDRRQDADAARDSWLCDGDRPEPEPEPEPEQPADRPSDQEQEQQQQQQQQQQQRQVDEIALAHVGAQFAQWTVTGDR